jgi:HAD superfamily hydrolase (TIGR01490 family)
VSAMSTIAAPRVSAALSRTEPQAPGAVLFSDVDDTLIRGKSLLGFAEHLARSLEPAEAALVRQVMEALVHRMRQGEPRTALNRAYYEGVLQGRSVDSVSEIARSWYRESLASGDFFNAPVRHFLGLAREAGTKIVLLSGSFRELLEPIAADVGASAMVIAPLERQCGRYTGRLVGSPTVEAGKADALLDYARRERIDLAECGGVGDDLADVPFLELVGFRFVPANAHPEMLRQAHERDWRVLTASPAPDLAGYLA